MSSISSLAAATLLVAACGTDSRAVAPCVPDSTAPTYSELYTRYFAPGTPGHCATSGCHGGQFIIWQCGSDKDTCYRGMTSPASGLIDTAMPSASLIIDPRSSPLSWFNPNGPMPQDTPGAFPEGRDAIRAWVEACAENN
jgi:hypothetical protein